VDRIIPEAREPEENTEKPTFRTADLKENCIDITEASAKVLALCGGGPSIATHNVQPSAGSRNMIG